jgi:dipeptidyl aminopeptidase/acylaminoacyl peptidase
LNIQSVSNAQISPDGNSIVCVVTSCKNNSWHTNIVLVDIFSKEQKDVDAGESPRWSADGKLIAYLGDNNGCSAIFIYDVENISKAFLVDIYESDYFIDHLAANNFCWSPDGKSIAYISTVPFSKSDDSSVSRQFDHLLYKSKGGRGRQVYADNRRIHIWIISIKEKITRPVFVNEFDQHSISFCPDGKKICFVSNTTGNPDLNQWSRIFSAEISTGKVNQISNETGSAFVPSWSPDGKSIAYLGITSEISTNDSMAEDTQLYIIPSSGGSAKCLTGSLDRRIEQISWDPSSAYIYFTAGNAGNTILYRVSILSGEIESVISMRGKVTEYSISNDGKKIIYVHTDTTHIADVFLYEIENRTKIQLTHFNEELINKCTLQPAETFWYKSFDSTNVQGWLIKPNNFAPPNKYPLILVIHGGPHNMFGYEFEDRMQLLSANDYGVLFINPRGSSGYGQTFSSGSMKGWGEGDFEDLMYGVDTAIENNNWIDASRLGVTGQSYGGYMTNRIITKTKRFKAAIADGSISNLISFAGTSLYHSLMESEYQLSVYDNYDTLWKCSPLKDVKNVTTPVLFLHGEKDNEVPISQAEEMFVALKKLGVTTSFVQYTGEGHGWRPDLKPGAKVDLLTRMIEWFDEFLKKVSDN